MALLLWFAIFRHIYNSYWVASPPILLPPGWCTRISTHLLLPGHQPISRTSISSSLRKRECHQSITKSHTESDTLKANSNSICSDRLLWNVSFASSSSSLFDDIAPLRGKIKCCSSSSWRFTRADTTTTTSCKSKRRLAFLQL